LIILCGRFAVLQAPVLDGLSFDPFSFQQDGLAPLEIDTPADLRRFALRRLDREREALISGAVADAAEDIVRVAFESWLEYKAAMSGRPAARREASASAPRPPGNSVSKSGLIEPSPS
jgi:hypothetical protein